MLPPRRFATIQRGAFDELPGLVHDDVELVSKMQPGTTVHGRDDVADCDDVDVGKRDVNVAVRVRLD